MSMPIQPPFSVKASYQTDQYATGTYYQGGSQVFSHLATPPSSGVAAETASDSDAHAVGFSAYGNRTETQTVTISGTPTGGTFKLSWGGQTTSTIAYNAAASTVQTALNALSSVPAAAGGTNEVQTATITGTPTGGTFTLTYSGQTTGAIAFNAAASVVQTALIALSNIGPGDVTVTGSAGGPYTVTFGGTLAATDVAAMTASGASLTGGTSPGVTIATPTAGVANTPNVTVSGSAGGPYTISYGALLNNKNVAQISADYSGLTGGTNAKITVATTAEGRSAFTNQAAANVKQQYDGMRNFYDAASGNHF